MKILIVRVGAMGDVLHALPSVAALRRAHPDWTIDWVVTPHWSPLLVDHEARGPIVSRVHLAETKQWSREPLSLTTLRSLRKLRHDLRAERYDLVIDMQGTLRSAVIGRMAGAPVFAGYAEPREQQAAWFYTSKFPRLGAHVVEMGASLLSAATGVALTPHNVELPPEEWADNWAAEEAATGKLCILAPGAGWRAKQWPIASCGLLAQKLKALGFDVVVNAPRKDNALAAEVIAASRSSENGPAARMVVCNVAGLIALTRRAALLIGGDSGPIHLAAALGIPLVALFGPTDPARNGPWGPGPQRVLRDPSSVTSYKRLAEPDPGLARISPQAVLEATQAIFRGPS